MPLRHELYTQLFTGPPHPTADFTGKTIVVTGSNVGLGKEAVKHFVRLKAARVIIACRSVKKGEAAKHDIEAESKLAPDVIEIMKLDYGSYVSCQAFEANIAKLDRLDAVILNAGMTTEKFEMLEDNESQITVNVISTTLLALLLLPTLRASAAKHTDSVPSLTIVNSGVHAMTKFNERKSPNSLATLNSKETAVISDRYQVSKLLSLFAMREMAEKTVNVKPFVIINAVNPGLCYTELNRNLDGGTAMAMKVMKALLTWTAEEGSRTEVYATVAGPKSHGVFISGSRIPNTGQSKFVTSQDGQKTQKKVWAEISEKLEKVQPGITTSF